MDSFLSSLTKTVVKASLQGRIKTCSVFISVISWFWPSTQRLGYYGILAKNSPNLLRLSFSSRMKTVRGHARFIAPGLN